ncbi:putative ribonuclease H-like domain-containing protein [Tanacetum coccineum]
MVNRNKKDKRGVVVRNKARLVAQGHRQEEGIDYDEVYVSQPPVLLILDHPTKAFKELLKFDLVNVKVAITPMETKLPLTKDEEAFDVDVHLYRSMIGNSKDFSSQCCQEDLQVPQGQTKLGIMDPRESPLIGSIL